MRRCLDSQIFMTGAEMTTQQTTKHQPSLSHQAKAIYIEKPSTHSVVSLMYWRISLDGVPLIPTLGIIVSLWVHCQN